MSKHEATYEFLDPALFEIGDLLEDPPEDAGAPEDDPKTYEGDV